MSTHTFTSPADVINFHPSNWGEGRGPADSVAAASELCTGPLLSTIDDSASRKRSRCLRVVAVPDAALSRKKPNEEAFISAKNWAGWLLKRRANKAGWQARSTLEQTAEKRAFFGVGKV